MPILISFVARVSKVWALAILATAGWLVLYLPGVAAGIRQGGVVRTDAVTVHLGQDTASFRLAQGVVTQIDLHVNGAQYSIPLPCAGGLRNVRFQTAYLLEGDERAKAEGSFSLLFEMGDEEDRRFDKLPRVQLMFRRRRLTEMLVERMEGPRSALSSKLCSTIPEGPITCKDTRQLQGLPPDVLVQQLRDLPAPIPNRYDDAERKRASIYEELLDWGAASIPSLVAGLKDQDVRLRRNVVLAFQVLSGGWWRFECGPAKLDVHSAFPALLPALRDSDEYVRAWTAYVFGDIGPNAAEAVPGLIELLKGKDEGPRYAACQALSNIGPAAKAALPELRAMLSHKSKDESACAAQAIQRIER